MTNNNKNLITIIIIMVGFLFLWDKFVVSRFSPPKPAQSPTSSSGTNTIERNAELKTPAPGLSQAGAAEAIKTNGVEKQFRLQNDKMSALIGSRGGRVLSWIINEKGQYIQLVTTTKGSSTAPLETFPELNFTLLSSSDRELVLTAKHPSGFAIRKTLTIGPDSYNAGVSMVFKNLTASQLPIAAQMGWGEGLNKKYEGGKHDPDQEKAYVAEMRAVGFTSKIQAWKPGMIFNRSIGLTLTQPFKWVAVDNNHFIAAFLFEPNDSVMVRVIADKSTSPSIQLPIEFALQKGATLEKKYRLYVGPKIMSELKNAGHGLDNAVEYGMFGVIAKVLLRALLFFKNLTGNFGWAIIILTIIMQILILPLTKKSLEFSIRMKEVQPQIKKVQEQFKSDPKRLQIETMNIYRKHGMKLMGLEGCLPVLIQMPIFFAFYKTLQVAYELRGAPWIFWIKDLALYDPYYVLPIIMGGGMLLQQKMTSVQADPAQAKMMLFMPVIFTFMFLKLPAGLVLYWCVNSVTTIITQQILTWQRHAHPKMTGANS